MLADYHVHTEFSNDSIYPMEEVVKDAISLGIKDTATGMIQEESSIVQEMKGSQSKLPLPM